MKAPTILVSNGHSLEGEWMGDPKNDLTVTFKGDLICGPHDDKGEHRWICSQCGRNFAYRACGPTHALIWHNRRALVAEAPLTLWNGTKGVELSVGYLPGDTSDIEA